MKINNIDTEKAGKFAEEVRKDPSKAVKNKKVTGKWNFDSGKPQFEAIVEFAGGTQKLESDQAPFLGGAGARPDPIQYCLYGLAACYAGTFMAIATMEKADVTGLTVTVENQVNLTRAMGLSDKPIVEKVKITAEVHSTESREKLNRIAELSRYQCPGVFCLTNPIPLEIEVK